MTEFVFLLEEASAKALLVAILPRLLPAEAVTTYLVFNGKNDLEKRLDRKLKSYLNPNAKFVVMRDQDQEDCRAVKRRLQNICTVSGKPQTLVRIVCRELESWYLGDLAAVENGLNCVGVGAYQKKARFRNPDVIPHAKLELKKLTNQAYMQTQGSRAIEPHMDFSNNTSTSFRAFISGLNRLIAS